MQLSPCCFLVRPSPSFFFCGCSCAMSNTPKIKTPKTIYLNSFQNKWLHPSHPDPKGETLRMVAKQCQKKLRENAVSDDRFVRLDIPRFSLFWDYASLYQHPMPSHGVYRTSRENELFRLGLESLPQLFYSAVSECYRITKFPPGYPRGYDLSEGANRAEYYERGWPFVESCLISLQKHRISAVKDLCHSNADALVLPRVPMVPSRMEQKLQQVSFTNAKDDRPLVLKLYEFQFVRHFTSLTDLSIDDAEWNDDHLMQMAEIIRMNHVPNLKEISLKENVFGERGCRALGEALFFAAAARCSSSSSSSDTLLESITIESCPNIGDTAIQALAKALLLIPNVTIKNCCNVRQGACEALAQAPLQLRQEGKDVKLKWLHLPANTGINDDGARALAPLLFTVVEWADLQRCSIGDKGCQAWAEAVHEYPSTSLCFIDIGNNKPMTTGAGQYLVVVQDRFPDLNIFWTDYKEGHGGPSYRFDASIWGNPEFQMCGTYTWPRNVPNRRGNPKNW